MNRKAWFKEQLKKYDRIAVAGGPKAGKTTLCRLVRDRTVIHTDSFMHDTWENVPRAVIADIVKTSPQRFVVEGVQVPRCLRKGLEVDAVLWLDEPLEKLSPRREGMRKGCLTVFADWYKDHKDVHVLQAPPVAKDSTNDIDSDDDT
jgi:ABC-type thiamine transport system ATPase subunit